MKAYQSASPPVARTVVAREMVRNYEQICAQDIRESKSAQIRCNLAMWRQDCLRRAFKISVACKFGFAVSYGR
jgi:hypothetical protein